MLIIYLWKINFENLLFKKSLGMYTSVVRALAYHVEGPGFKSKPQSVDQPLRGTLLTPTYSHRVRAQGTVCPVLWLHQGRLLTSLAGLEFCSPVLTAYCPLRILSFPVLLSHPVVSLWFLKLFSLVDGILSWLSCSSLTVLGCCGPCGPASPLSASVGNYWPIFWYHERICIF